MKIGFVGAGNMASAIMNGIVSKGLYKPEDIYVTDKDKAKVESFVARGMHSLACAGCVGRECDLIFLAIKPQNIDEVLEVLRNTYRKETTVVSIVAGISTEYIKSGLGCDAKVIRTMPNTPLMLGCGATAMSKVSPVTDAEFALSKSIFEAVGVVAVIDEAQMNEIISVNGSSPAYIYLFAKSIIDGAVRQGIDYDVAKVLTIQTFLGSALMLQKGDYTPEELIKMVSSPGGTTLKALEAFENDNLTEIVSRAMQACTDRAIELSAR